MKNQDIKIEILLATYNGEMYLQELLDSLLSQTYENWVLIISDDGSDDNTLDILHNFNLLYPSKIQAILEGPCQGPCKNFFHLMDFSGADLLAFCDQDDVWKPKKLEMMVERYHCLLNRFDASIPILIFTNATVVDDKLNIISESMLQDNIIEYEGKKLFDTLQYTNFITGCCLLANKHAVQIALENRNKLIISYNHDVVMHDHWLGLVTAFHGGIISYLNKNLILYRQHLNNAVGAEKKGYLSKLSPKKLNSAIDKYKMVKHFNARLSFLSYLIRHILHSFFKGTR